MKKVILSIMSVILVIMLFSATTKADTKNGITVITKSSSVEQDELTFEFNNYEITGNYIGLKINAVYGYKAKSPVKWLGVRLFLYDDKGNAYSYNTSGITTDSGVMTPTFDEHGNQGSATIGNSYIWPLMGLYETVYMSLSNFVNGANSLKAGTTITKAMLRYDTRDGQRDSLKMNLFGLYDGTLDYHPSEIKSSWIGDVEVLCSFDVNNSDYSLTSKNLITDFGTYDLNGENISLNEGAVSELSYIDENEYNDLVNQKENRYKNWEALFPKNGQPFSIKPVDNGVYKEALFWEYGDYVSEYQSKLNSYGSLAISVTNADWSKAKGVTIYVKNYQQYPASFGFEFAETEDGGVERWNLNSTKYRKIYAYDVITGEEYAFHTSTVIKLPANFEGWLRIAFQEFECPEWSQAYAWTDGVLDLNKPHANIYITSQFIINDSCQFLFDNIGIYYSDFQVGKLFDRTYPSIKECLESKYEVTK